MSTSLRPADFARAAAFALLPAVAGAGAMGLPVLIGLAGIIAIAPSILRQVLEKQRTWLWLLLALTGWAALSSLWSAWDGPTAAKVLLVVGTGLLFAATAGANEKSATLTLAGATAAFLVLAALLGVEAGFDMPLNRAAEPDLPYGELNRNPSRGLVVLLALVWPVTAWVLATTRGAMRLAVLGIVAVGAVLSLQFDQQSTAIGFGVGLVVFVIASANPRAMIVLLSFGLAAWMLAAPFATPILFASQQLVDALPFSWAHRVGIWRYTCERIMEQPWIGHGIDAGRATTEMITTRGYETRGIPVHPHSASLQVWHDLGFNGALVAAVLLAYGGWRLSRAFALDKLGGAATAAVLAMFGLMANIGWSIWQEWWISTLLLTAGLIAAVRLRAAKA
ncbi:MAG: O-antigen ligase family protein [Hyphomonadaceae bacterium]